MNKSVIAKGRQHIFCSSAKICGSHKSVSQLQRMVNPSKRGCCFVFVAGREQVSSDIHSIDFHVVNEFATISPSATPHVHSAVRPSILSVHSHEKGKPTIVASCVIELTLPLLLPLLLFDKRNISGLFMFLEG